MLDDESLYGKLLIHGTRFDLLLNFRTIFQKFLKIIFGEACGSTSALLGGILLGVIEIFAGAYKDYGKAKLVGTTTFGKGIVQFVLPLGDGSAVKITTQHYYTPNGFDLHGKGIEPDVKAEPGEDDVIGSDKDAQLEAALKAIAE